MPPSDHFGIGPHERLTMKTTHLIHVAGLCLCPLGAVAQTPVLTVYTYDSFVTEWGPGPLIESGFEATCGCDVQFVGHGDGAALLAKLKLEGSRTKADVVIGLDTSLIVAARDTGLFATADVDATYDLPLPWTDDTFVPYDWGYFAFVGNAGQPAATSLQGLADSDIKIVIEDPRSSTPGLGLVLWVQMTYGDGAPALWSDLADNIVTVTPGWSEAYGLFLAGEADAVLSYTTSPAYHLIAEDDATKVAWTFDEGHYMQVEVAARLVGSDQPELAQQFLTYLVSDAAQAVIPTTNWMFPAVTPDSGLPAGFPAKLAPEQSLLMTPDAAAAIRDSAVEEWRAALAR